MVVVIDRTLPYQKSLHKFGATVLPNELPGKSRFDAVCPPPQKVNRNKLKNNTILPAILLFFDSTKKLHKRLMGYTTIHKTVRDIFDDDIEMNDDASILDPDGN